MIIGRLFGYLLLIVALAAVGFGVYMAVAGLPLTEVAGRFWFDYDSASLGLAEAVVTRYILSDLWYGPVLWLLQQKVWFALLAMAIAFGVPGAALVIAFRRRRSRSRFN